MAFCVEHCEMAKQQQIPTKLHDYLKYTNKMTAPKARKCQTNDVDLQETAADCQGIASSATISDLLNVYKTGISTLLNSHPNLPAVVDYTDEEEATMTSCNKDTGTRKKVQKWTRGHLLLFVVVATLRPGSLCTSESCCLD